MMAENTNTTVVEDAVDPNEPVEEKIEHDSELADRINKLEVGQDMMALLADAEVQDVIRAKQAGRTVRVVVDEAEPAPNVAEEVTDLTKDLDEDDPNRDLLDGLSKLLDTKLEVIDQRLAAVEGVAKTSARKEVSDQVSVARKKFKDFNEYKADILELSKELEGLDVNELYIIAKNRKGNLKIDEPTTDVERPTTISAAHRRTGAKKPSEPRRGRSGFQSILTEKLEALNLDELE